MARVKRVGAAVALDVAVGAVGEVAGEHDEDEHDDDLEGETGDHDVGAELEQVWVVGWGAGGHTAAEGLEGEGDDVAGDEEAGIGFGGDAGVGYAKSEDDALDAEVDAGGVEGGADGQADDVHEEAGLKRNEKR